MAFKTFRRLDLPTSSSSVKPNTEDTDNEEGQEAGEDEEGQSKPASADEIIDGHLIERVIPNYQPINDGRVKVVAYDSAVEKQLAISGFDHKTSQIAL